MIREGGTTRMSLRFDVDTCDVPINDSLPKKKSKSTAVVDVVVAVERNR